MVSLFQTDNLDIDDDDDDFFEQKPKRRTSLNKPTEKSFISDLFGDTIFKDDPTGDVQSQETTKSKTLATTSSTDVARASNIEFNANENNTLIYSQDAVKSKSPNSGPAYGRRKQRKPVDNDPLGLFSFTTDSPADILETKSAPDISSHRTASKEVTFQSPLEEDNKTPVNQSSTAVTEVLWQRQSDDDARLQPSSKTLDSGYSESKESNKKELELQIKRDDSKSEKVGNAIDKPIEIDSFTNDQVHCAMYPMEFADYKETGGHKQLLELSEMELETVKKSFRKQTGILEETIEANELRYKNDLSRLSLFYEHNMEQLQKHFENEVSKYKEYISGLHREHQNNLQQLRETHRQFSENLNSMHRMLHQPELISATTTPPFATRLDVNKLETGISECSELLRTNEQLLNTISVSVKGGLYSNKEFTDAIIDFKEHQITTLKITLESVKQTSEIEHTRLMALIEKLETQISKQNTTADCASCREMMELKQQIHVNHSNIVTNQFDKMSHDQVLADKEKEELRLTNQRMVLLLGEICNIDHTKLYPKRKLNFAKCQTLQDELLIELKTKSIENLLRDIKINNFDMNQNKICK